MNEYASAVFAGHVVHKRLSPKQHGFAYRVFALSLDVDEIDLMASQLRLFSRNAFNALSFHDCDHGPGDGTPVARHIRTTVTEAGLGVATARIRLLCYPRILGYVFNPLSVYFCYEAGGRLGAVVYEVSNTFNERVSYVIPVAAGAADVVHQVCAKQMYVSPFTPQEAHYAFHVRPPGEKAGKEVVVGIALRDAAGPVLKTHFRGRRLALTDRTLALMLARHPLMTLKVVGAIHFEAARLWLKGVPPVRRHTSPRYTISVIDTAKRQAIHAE